MNLKQDVLEALGKLGIQNLGAPVIAKNANEVMHTTNTNKGAELVPTAELAQQVFEAIPEYGTFMNALPGNHGTGLGKSQEVSVLGDVGFFDLHSEKTTSAFALAQGNKTMATDKITLTQKQFDLTIDVSNELAQFNRLGAAGLEAKLKEKIAKAMVRTVESLMINGDTTNAGTGNVNLDDADPADTLYYLAAKGLRYYGVGAGSSAATKVSVGSFDFADLISVYGLLGDLAADPANVLWLFNRATYNKALGIAEFANAATNGLKSTANTGAITNILGSDVFVARDLPKTEADGKVSTTASNNTLGQFIAFWKPAIQFGFGQELQLWLAFMGKDGWQLQGWFNYAQAIVQNMAGVTDSSVGVGYNVTL